MNSLTQTASAELAPRIRVNGIAPGAVPTEIFKKALGIRTDADLAEWDKMSRFTPAPNDAAQQQPWWQNLVSYGIREPRLGAIFLSALGLLVVGFMVLVTTKRAQLLEQYRSVQQLLSRWES